MGEVISGTVSVPGYYKREGLFCNGKDIFNAEALRKDILWVKDRRHPVQ
jgi:hypothetical protein